MTATEAKTGGAMAGEPGSTGEERGCTERVWGPLFSPFPSQTTHRIHTITDFIGSPKQNFYMQKQIERCFIMKKNP